MGNGFTWNFLHIPTSYRSILQMSSLTQVFASFVSNQTTERNANLPQHGGQFSFPLTMTAFPGEHKRRDFQQRASFLASYYFPITIKIAWWPGLCLLKFYPCSLSFDFFQIPSKTFLFDAHLELKMLFYAVMILFRSSWLLRKGQSWAHTGYRESSHLSCPFSSRFELIQCSKNDRAAYIYPLHLPPPPII